MGNIARLKQLTGQSGSSNGGDIRTLASAATMFIPENYTRFYVSGTTGITALSVDRIRPGREISLIGSDNTGPAITDTALSGTGSGKIHLAEACTLAIGQTIKLTQRTNGSWVQSGKYSAVN